MRGVMLQRCLAAATLLALGLGPLKTVSGEASGQSVQRLSETAGITVEGMLEEGGQARRQYSCPARFIRMGNSCYFLSKTMATWQDAHFRCRAMGAQLAAFEKRSENSHMRKLLMREEMAPLARWIGGTYQWEKRFWMWGSSGLPVSYTAFPRRRVTRDWAWHCISMDPTAAFHWKPASCLHVKHYICETPLRRTRARARSQDAGTKHLKGPRRKEEDVLVDKGSRRGVQRRPAAGPDLPVNVTSAAAPGSRRPDDRRPTAETRPHVGGGVVHRHNHAFRPRVPAPPPGPGPRQPGAGGPRRRRPRPVDPAVIYPALRKASSSASARGGPRRPQQTHDYGDKRTPSWPHWPSAPRRLPEMPDATVQTLYPPPVARRDNNDFSNDV